MTLKETTINYCTEVIEGLQKMIDAKAAMDLFLNGDERRVEAFKQMVEHDPTVVGLFNQMEELTNKLEM